MPTLPSVCGSCGGNILKPFKWSLDLGCKGAICDVLRPKGGGCHGRLCDLLKCHIGCGGGKKGGKKEDDEDEEGEEDDDDDDEDGGGGGGSKPDKPDEDKPDEDKPDENKPDEKPDDNQSSSQSSCETKTATDITAFCNIFTEVVASASGSSTVLAPRTTCTSMKKHVTQGCSVKGTTTSRFDSCSKTQTATDFTKYCTESVSGGKTYTPCTKTVSTVFEGCSVIATTSSVIDSACQAMVTFAPDDPQGEFGSLPQNDTCPFFPGVDVSSSDDQGQDGKKSNGTCTMWNGTRPSFDDDQGSDDRTCKAKNGTTTRGGAGGSCPISNATLIQGPDGAEDGSETCSMSNDTMVLELGFLDQGQDGFLNQSCQTGTNLTMIVDAEQGEDGSVEQSCPAIPEGVLITPLADQGTYELTNASCPLLDPKFPISPMDEQSDDWDGISCSAPNITIEWLPDDPPDDSSSKTTKASTSKNTCVAPKRSGLGKCTVVAPRKRAFDMKTMFSCACESQTKGQVVEISDVCGTPMCPNGVINETPRTSAPLIFVDPSGNTIQTVRGPPSTTITVAPPKLTTTKLVPSDKPPSDKPYSYPPVTCNCDVPKRPELGACSLKVTIGNAAPGPNYMVYNPAPKVTFCGCESGRHVGTTICGQYACPNGPKLETPAECPPGSCAWPTNTKLGQCASRSARVFTGGEPDNFRTFDYCMCDHQRSMNVPMLTGCDGVHVCPNQVDLVTDKAAYSNVEDVACTEQLPSLSFWDSCVYTRDPAPKGVASEAVDDIKHTCMCKIADNKGVTNHYRPITARCGAFLCHNSAPVKLERRAVDPERIGTPIDVPPSFYTAVTPLIAVTIEPTPGSLPTAKPGPTSTVSLLLLDRF